MLVLGQTNSLSPVVWVLGQTNSWYPVVWVHGQTNSWHPFVWVLGQINSWSPVVWVLGKTDSWSTVVWVLGKTNSWSTVVWVLCCGVGFISRIRVKGVKALANFLNCEPSINPVWMKGRRTSNKCRIWNPFDKLYLITQYSLRFFHTEGFI